MKFCFSLPIHNALALISEVVLYILYSGYFWGGNIFVVFVVERQGTKYLPTKNR